MVLNDLREKLTAKFPDADFTPYFDFIDSLPPTEVGHRHHILPKKEFPEHRKDVGNIVRMSPQNHLLAHYYLAVCSPHFDLVFYLMTNTSAFQINRGDLPFFAEIYKQGRDRQLQSARLTGLRAAESGQIQKLGMQFGPENGRRQGQHNVETGHLDTVRTKVSCSKGGQANAKSGWAAQLGRSGVGGRISGSKAAASGQIQALGYVQGRLNVENGHLDSIRSLANQVKGGRVSGKNRVESGHMAKIQTPENRAKANHVRWHINRNVLNPNCSFCSI
jgi:hypothetical protein